MPIMADLTVKTGIHQKIKPLTKTLGTWEHPTQSGWELKELLNALNSDEVNLKGIARNIQDSLKFEVDFIQYIIQLHFPTFYSLHGLFQMFRDLCSSTFILSLCAGCSWSWISMQL